jgi:hypothetical protein
VPWRCISPLKSMDGILRELDELRARGRMSAEPAVAEAALVVARALTTLTAMVARQSAGHKSDWDPEAAEAVLAQARLALGRARNAVGRSRQLDPPPAIEREAVPPASISASCSACGRSFVVQYVSREPSSLVSFLIACPWEDCDSISEVSCPADSVSRTAVVLPI